MSDKPSDVPPAHEIIGNRDDERMRGAWRAWLCSLATDAEAATAAAHLYGELPGAVRDAWLDALGEDAPNLDVPRAAIYCPLLAVERDPARRERIRKGSKTRLGSITRVRYALLGTGSKGVRVGVLVIPMYLQFVRVIVCRIVKHRGFDWVQQDPIGCQQDAPVAGSVVDGVELLSTSAQVVVDELAHAVLAHRRSGRELPRILYDCADLFSASLSA